MIRRARLRKRGVNPVPRAGLRSRGACWRHRLQEDTRLVIDNEGEFVSEDVMCALMYMVRGGLTRRVDLTRGRVCVRDGRFVVGTDSM